MNIEEAAASVRNSTYFIHDLKRCLGEGLTGFWPNESVVFGYAYRHASSSDCDVNKIAWH